MKNELVELSTDLAVEILKFRRKLKKELDDTELLSQFVRSVTSIGANIREANYGSSKADFINKLQISQKESNEADYWLDIFYKSEYISVEDYNLLFGKLSKIRKILAASLKTAKKIEN